MAVFNKTTYLAKIAEVRDSISKEAADTTMGLIQATLSVVENSIGDWNSLLKRFVLLDIPSELNLLEWIADALDVFHKTVEAGWT